MKKLVALLMLSAFMLFVGGSSYALSQTKDTRPKVEQFKKMDVVVVYDFNYSVDVPVLPKPMSEVPAVIGKAITRPAEAKANSPPFREHSNVAINPNARIRKL